MKLGVNIDHIATLRQVRQAAVPDPVVAAALAEMAGAAGITVHLREDRRHIQDADVIRLRQSVRTKLNLEMSLAPAIVERALEVAPPCACLVPERRQELTTEGGLDVCAAFDDVARVTGVLQANGTLVSLFIDPDLAQVDAAANAKATFIELHTGAFAAAQTEDQLRRELDKLVRAARHAHARGLRVNAGHGLDYHNVHLIHQVPHVEELNIGHAIVARAVLVGLDRAVRDMLALIAPHSQSPLNP
ncbi:MAG: pyridoxine 5'-phosphate synthase [bacterium]|nr:pyridoxine 5'-phosphate synthase [bacterium]